MKWLSGYYPYSRSTVLSFLLCIGGIGLPSSQGQNIILRVDSELSIPDECGVFLTGETITFERGLGIQQCDPVVFILRDDNPTPLLTTSDLIFEFTFDKSGLYTIFCGGPDFPEISTTAACFIVTDEIIPTLGQWGIINLMLMLGIVSLVAIRNRCYKELTIG